MREGEQSPPTGVVAALRAATLGVVGTRAAAVLVLVGVVALSGVPAEAQDAGTGAHVEGAALNVLTGGLTAAVAALLGGHDVIDAAVGGALGGSGAYVGKRVAAQRFDSAGLLGRELAAVGTSVVINAGEGRRSRQRIALGAALHPRSGAPRFHGDRWPATLRDTNRSSSRVPTTAGRTPPESTNSDHHA